MVTTQTEKQITGQSPKRVPLPIDDFLESIVQAVHEHSNVIVVAEPGAGKTTRVPPALLKTGKWIVLQPRRWAAKLTASRIAEENSWKLGEDVGYQVRFENKTSKNSRLIVMTEGVLIRKLIQDPELQGITGVILDEFHERSLDLDVALALLREIQESLKPELKIVVMSATLDPTPLEKFLPDVKTFKISGRTYPVTQKYLGNVSVLSAVRTVLNALENSPEFENGDFLIFLPGAFEIQKAVRDIEEHLFSARLHKEIEVLPLYSNLPESEQKKVFQETLSATGERKRKIICSTNIAETSITLPHIKVVIDQGFGKFMRTDPQLGQDRLETLRISRASSEQRAGRAGRVSAGVCYRLWTEGEQTQLRHFETPEIHRVSLSDALLMLSEFGVSDFSRFSWFESPKSSMLDYSLRELERLYFLVDGRITEEGRQALKLPLSPPLAKLVIVADQEKVRSFGARMVAYLENQNGVQAIQSDDELLIALNQLNGAALQSAKQIMGSASLAQVTPSEWPLYEKVLVRACSSRIFMNGLMVGRRKIGPRDSSRVLPRIGLVLNSMEKVERGVPQIVIQSFIPIEAQSLDQEAKKKKNVFWDNEAKRVRTLEGYFFEDLELGSVTEVASSGESTERILSEYILKNTKEVLREREDFLRWLSRVEFYERHRGGENPSLDWSWNELIQAACSGKAKLEQVLQFPFQDYIEGALDRKLLAKFNEWVPDKIEVPSHSHHRIDYTSDIPKLSVRLQEIFGWLETPKVMGGRIPILIELLSPRFEAIQLTQDLKSFWKHAYFEVKKELKARYPKHAWPEDPLTAKAEAKGGRRK